MLALLTGLAYGAGLADNLEASLGGDISVVDLGVKGSGPSWRRYRRCRA
jgi:hypothetical protein